MPLRPDRDLSSASGSPFGAWLEPLDLGHQHESEELTADPGLSGSLPGDLDELLADASAEDAGSRQLAAESLRSFVGSPKALVTLLRLAKDDSRSVSLTSLTEDKQLEVRRGATESLAAINSTNT